MCTLCVIALLNFPYMDKIHITIILAFLDHSLSNSRVTRGDTTLQNIREARYLYAFQCTRALIDRTVMFEH